MSTTAIILIVAVVAILALLASMGGGGPRVTTIERRHSERDGEKDPGDA